MKKKLLFLSLFTINVLMAQVPSYVPTNGLVGYWPFNGNANDASGNGNNGIVNGAILTTDRNGNANSAYSFAGNSWIEVLYNQVFNFSTNSFTLICWAKRQGNNTFQHLITRNYIPDYPNAISNYTLRYENNSIVLISSGNTSTGNGALGSSALSNLTDWNHFVSVFNSENQTLQIYMNGNLIATGPTNSILQNYNSIGNMYFGVEHPTTVLPSGPQFLTGQLDDIGIWNRALTQAEITGLYNTLSNSQTEAVNQIAIYPNPAKDQITIDCGNISSVSGWNYTIVNTLGQEVSNGVMNSQQNVVSLNILNGTGVYLVKIYDAESNLISTKKIIKE
jgi:hypothetical protein